MDQRIINLYDDYTHTPLSRGEFINRLVLLTGSITAAMAVLPLIEVNAANAAVTIADDLFTETVSFKGVPGDMKAYVARPAEKKKYPAIKPFQAEITTATPEASRDGTTAKLRIVAKWPFADFHDWLELLLGDPPGTNP